jgi:hypothetical protein
MLLTLAAIVWVTRRDTDSTATVLSLVIGACTTLGGYYQGNRDADRATEREAIAKSAATQLLNELRRARESLEEAGLENEVEAGAEVVSS